MAGNGHGGRRQGSGRNPKADEIKIIEQMDAVAAPAEVWQKLWEKCEEGDTTALKTWLNYRFGMPKQSMNVESDGINFIMNFKRND